MSFASTKDLRMRLLASYLGCFDCVFVDNSIAGYACVNESLIVDRQLGEPLSSDMKISSIGQCLKAFWHFGILRIWGLLQSEDILETSCK